ncbi:MAG: DEAD/DEAH box helicase [Ruminococcus sp.]|nr:DEAD/DEAH box helicase [Ruminococcus sp.]
MISDIIAKRLFQIDNYARDARGNINEDDKLNQFIDNIINDASLDPSFGEDYIDYSIRNINNENIKKIEVPEMYKFQGDYVSSEITDQMIKTWHPGGNIFISAGTGKGKNTFIKNHLLKFSNDNSGNIIIFENRESLLSQQKIDLINSIDPQAAIYKDLEGTYKSENMVVFGRHKNIMLISYQKAALKLLCGDNYFMDFLNLSRYVVFDEVHYLIDDSDFNKGVNTIADNLIQCYRTSEGQLLPNPLIPIATRIFMSGSMEEMFVVFQQMGYYFNNQSIFINHFNVNHFNEVTEDDTSLDIDIDIMRYFQSLDHIVSVPTDYSYISPYMYKEYSDIIPLIKDTNDKWLIFINSKKQGNELCNEINSVYGENTAVFLNADNKRSKDMTDTYQNLLNNERFENKVLITTNVIYNGVNIKDKALKNIVIPMTTVPIMKQQIGRKRLSAGDNSLNVYFPKASYDEIRKRFKKNIGDYFEIMNFKPSVVNGNVSAINELYGEISKYIYAKTVPQYPQPYITLNLSMLANMKLHFEAMFNLFMLHRLKDDEEAYIKVLLEHLGIGHKFEEVVNVIPLTEEEKIANAKEEMIKLLDEYCANSIIDVCVEGEYTEIPKFTEKVNSIYKSVYDKAINSQWANRKRTVADNIFNDFIKALGLPYAVEISSKDKTTGAKTLTVTKK